MHLDETDARQILVRQGTFEGQVFQNTANEPEQTSFAPLDGDSCDENDVKRPSGASGSASGGKASRMLHDPFVRPAPALPAASGGATRCSQAIW